MNPRPGCAARARSRDGPARLRSVEVAVPAPSPEPGSVAERPGCLAVLASPSCFGFLLFVCLWLGVVAWHDLAI